MEVNNIYDQLIPINSKSKGIVLDLIKSWPMLTGSAHHYIHSNFAGTLMYTRSEHSVVFVFTWWTQASAIEAGNRPILSAALPLRCLPSWGNYLSSTAITVIPRTRCSYYYLRHNLDYYLPQQLLIKFNVASLFLSWPHGASFINIYHVNFAWELRIGRQESMPNRV